MSAKDQNKAPRHNSPHNDDDLESLTSDEKAAFEKIMSQIEQANDDDGANPDDSATDSEPSTATREKKLSDASKRSVSETESSADELTADQQAALDKIMTEIKGKENDDDPPQPEAQAPPAAGNDELTDDQQAALDRIMAEINGDEDTGDPPQPEAQAPPAAGDDELTADRQAALEKTAGEINARQKGTPPDSSPAEDRSPVPSADEPSNQPAPDAKESQQKGLSLEEFDDELSNLISTSQTGEWTHKGAGAGSDSEDISSAERKSRSAPASQGYTMLQEVKTGDPKSAGGNKKKKPRPGVQISLSRNALLKFMAAASVLIAAAGAYWGYDQWLRKPMTTEVAASAQVRKMPAADARTGAEPVAGAAPSPLPLPAGAQQEIAPARDLSPFAALRSDLGAARQQLQKKIEEIKELKTYYRKGINEEQRKIETQVSKMPTPTFKQAMANSRIELSLQAIQRRTIYIAKLDAPLEQLGALSERLLYLERRTRMLEVLNKSLSGLPISELKQDVAGTIAEQMDKSKQLSIDGVKVPVPTLASLWDDLQKNRGPAEKTRNSNAADHALNRKIAREVCKGDYGRKYLLTAMTAETAECLSKWQGKDLYLNNLTALTPGVARALAQWPGEWLSLNGVKTLSAESAKYLSQWPGRRLSLNGLPRLSSQATAHLSKWHGEQLEMVGLTSIGRWENYGTRLYLSETLKRKLKMP